MENPILCSITSKPENIVLCVDNFKTATIRWEKNKHDELFLKTNYESYFSLNPAINAKLYKMPYIEKFYHEWMLIIFGYQLQ